MELVRKRPGTSTDLQVSEPLVSTEQTMQPSLSEEANSCHRNVARNRGHFASVINCQRHLFFKMADKNNRSEGKRFPYEISNNFSSLDLFYEVCIP